MANTITDPDVIAFCNEHIRPLADVYATLYHYAKTAIGVWTTKALDQIVPHTTDTVADGSDQDGRGQITGNQLYAMIAELNAFNANMEANGSAKLNVIYNIAVNPKGR